MADSKRKKAQEEEEREQQSVDEVEYGEEGDEEDDQRGARFYDFSNTTVLLTHPAINGSETVQGCLTGMWSTRSTSRKRFEVVGVDATPVLPPLQVHLPGEKAPQRVHPGHIPVTLGGFDVPEHLQELFPFVNTGVVDVRNRLYRAVFGFYAHFPFAHGASKYLKVEPAPVLLLTVGNVLRGGALTASGLGTILSGFLNGAMLACGHPPTGPTPPPPCGVPHPNGVIVCTKPQRHGGKHRNPIGPGYTW